MWLTILINNWRTIAGGSVLVIAFAAGWHYGSGFVQSKWDAEIARDQAELIAQAKKHALVISNLETQKNENLAIIDSLVADNQRLYLHPTTCARPANPARSPATTAGNGALYADPSAAIADYSEQVGRIAADADKVIEQCRVMQSYLLSLADKN